MRPLPYRARSPWVLDRPPAWSTPARRRLWRSLRRNRLPGYPLDADPQARGSLHRLSFRCRIQPRSSCPWPAPFSDNLRVAVARANQRDVQVPTVSGALTIAVNGIQLADRMSCLPTLHRPADAQEPPALTMGMRSRCLAR